MSKSQSGSGGDQGRRQDGIAVVPAALLGP